MYVLFSSGISGASRKRRAEIVEALKKLIGEKGKTPTLKYQQTYEELRERSDMVMIVFQVGLA